MIIDQLPSEQLGESTVVQEALPAQWERVTGRHVMQRRLTVAAVFAMFGVVIYLGTVFAQVAGSPGTAAMITRHTGAGGFSQPPVSDMTENSYMLRRAWWPSKGWTAVPVHHVHRPALLTAPAQVATAPAVPLATNPDPQPSPSSSPSPATTTSPPSTGTTDWAATAFGACVRRAENGGSYGWGTGNGGGAYQFLKSSWMMANGSVQNGRWVDGSSAGYGSAGQGWQDAAFNNVMNNASYTGGANNWGPYDGCWP